MTVIWNLAPKPVNGSKSWKTQSGTTLWCHVQRYCARFPLFMLILCSVYFGLLLDNFTLWHRSIRTSQTQRAIQRGMRSSRILAAKILWSTRSNAFLSSRSTTRTAEPVPSVACPYVWTIEIRGWRVDLFGMAPYWLGSITSKTAGPMDLFTIKSSANFENAGVSEMGRICFLIIVTDFTFISGETLASFQGRSSKWRVQDVTHTGS